MQQSLLVELNQDESIHIYGGEVKYEWVYDNGYYVRVVVTENS